jgi:hypothetical protein
MVAGVRRVVRLGVFIVKKIELLKIREGLSVILLWWNMMHLLENKSLQLEVCNESLVGDLVDT